MAETKIEDLKPSYDFYADNVFENRDDINNICQIASGLIKERFRIQISETPVIASMFRIIYDAILDVLKSKEADFSSYEINICKRLLIGYTTSNDEDDEKQGNFMIYIRHCDNADISKNYTDEPNASSTTLLVNWNSNNKLESIDDLNKIQDLAITNINKQKICIANPELIIPFFITTYESIIEYLKGKLKELDEFEYEINFVGCFNIGAREGKDKTSVIYIRPYVSDKLKIKDDQKASSKYE